jgi:hypothetical protein
MASHTECGIIELTLNNEGGDLPVTYTITDPRDVTCQVQLVVNPGNSCTYTMEGFAPGPWTVPITAEDGWGNVTDEDQDIDVDCDCGEGECGTPSVEVEVNCGSTLVTLCLGATGGDVNYEITNPETLEVIVVLVLDGEEECIELELSCGVEWVIPIDACGEFFSQAVAFCDCLCPTPLEIKGFTPCRSGGLLGDGNDLRVLLVSRGYKTVIAELKPTSGEFTRVLDGTSTLAMEGTVSGRLEDSCCDGWDEIRPWATEIIVFRGGRDAWAGPVTDVVFGYGTVRVEADDLTAWFDRRTIPTMTFTGDDLTDMFLAIVAEALKPDDSMNMNIISQPTGVVGDRSYNGNLYQYAGDAIKELADTGLDYTAYSRNLIVGGEEVDASPFVTLLDEHWTEPPQVRDRGNEQATVVVVKGNGVQAVAFAPQSYIDFYGYLVRVFEEPDILDQGSCQVAADTRVDLLRDPQFIETPVGAGLKTTAPITLEQLIPGMRMRVDTQSTCRKIVNDFRLQQVTVNFDGTVSIDLQPLGHVAAAFSVGV